MPRPTTLPLVRLLALMIAVPLPAIAQGAPAAYARSAGDTLRYREISRGNVTLRSSGGTMPITTEHDAVMAITFVQKDTARAWYETLAVGMTSPQGTNRPATDEALGKPFTLFVDVNGRVRTLSVPEFPASFRGVTDLTKQFFDYFPVLPNVPLRAGTTWSDTVVLRDSTPDGHVGQSTRIARYRVERDTVVGARRALVISSRQEHRLESRGPAAQAGTSFSSTLAGVDSGVFVFAPSPGVLLGREREGRLEGFLVFEGGARPMSMPQETRYESTLTLVPAKP